MELTNYSEYFRFLRVMGKSVQATRTLSAFAALIGVLVTVGWVLRNESLIRLSPSLAPMVLNTALCLLSNGASVLLLTVNHLAARRASILLLSCTALIAILTLLEYAVGFGFGIDFMVGDASLGSPNPYTGRMSLMTSFCFLITSSCLLAYALKLPDRKWLPQYAMLFTFLIAVLGLTSIILDAQHYYSHVTTMALHTTIGFIMLCLAYFGLRANEGLAALVLSKTLAGKLTRSILIPLAILYPILSVIRLWGEKAGFYNAAGGTAFMMVAGLGLFIIITFISAQMVARLDREKEQYKKFFKLSTEMLVIASNDGYIKLASESFSKVLGYTPDEVLGNSYLSFIHLQDHASVKVQLEKLGRGEVINAFPLRLVTRAGQTKHFLWSVTPEVETGNLYAAGHDVTEIKEAEQVRALAEKLSHQNKQLASFAHIVSHNLRSPVGNLSALLNLYKIGGTADERDFIMEKFERVAEHLSTTLNDLVETLRIKEDVGQAREFIQFDDVLNKTREILTGQIMEANASITFRFQQPEINFPRIYLESIFLNLLSNAIKYRSSNRLLKVHFETLMINNSVALTVEDNGQGIDLSRHGDKLFGFYKAFHQGKDSKGMGLFLTKTQVEAMGGNISAESEVDKGTVFTIVFGKANNR